MRLLKTNCRWPACWIWSVTRPRPPTSIEDWRWFKQLAELVNRQPAPATASGAPPAGQYQLDLGGGVGNLGFLSPSLSTKYLAATQRLAHAPGVRTPDQLRLQLVRTLIQTAPADAHGIIDDIQSPTIKAQAWLSVARATAKAATPTPDERDDS